MGISGISAAFNGPPALTPTPPVRAGTGRSPEGSPGEESAESPAEAGREASANGIGQFLDILA